MYVGVSPERLRIQIRLQQIRKGINNNTFPSWYHVSEKETHKYRITSVNKLRCNKKECIHGTY